MTTDPPGELFIGEVHTGLLQNSLALTAPAVAQILRIRSGEPVRLLDRPIRYAVSPPLLTGVDCRPWSPAGGPRVVGVVSSRSMVTGGHILQTSSFAHLTQGHRSQRATWSYYLARPGVLETLGRPLPGRAAENLLSGEDLATGIDLNAINTRLMDLIQSAGLDRLVPFRIPRTKLRWMGRYAPTTRVHFSLEDGNQRSLRLGFVTGHEAPWAAVASFCEDVALHDWLLTALMQVIDKAVGGPREDLVRRLRPLLDHLLHLWMPAARPSRAVAPLWASLEQEVGFSRQWNTAATWVRDQVGIGSLFGRPGPYP